MAIRVSAREIAEQLGGELIGQPDLQIDRIGTLTSATPSTISFLSNPRYQAQLAQTQAGCVIVAPESRDGAAARPSAVITPDPYLYFARLTQWWARRTRVQPLAGVHASAVVDGAASVAASACIGPGAVIEAGALVGEHAVIGAFGFVGAGASVGAQSRFAARVTLNAGCRVGERCIVHSGVVIGADGFGFAMIGGRYEKFPQIGAVNIANDVEIGANSCIDRATLGVTTIGEGSKLDNLVHIAHNCQIGKHVVIAAQTGFAGGVVIEDYAVIGGQVGIGDKARVESHAVLGSGAGVLTSKIVRAGEVMWGTPARPLRQYLTQLASLSRVPELRKQVRELERKLRELSK